MSGQVWARAPSRCEVQARAYGRGCVGTSATFALISRRWILPVAPRASGSLVNTTFSGNLNLASLPFSFMKAMSPAASSVAPCFR